MSTRAIHSGYYTGATRAGQVRRVHIIRDGGGPDRPTAMCGQGIWPTTNSIPVVLDPMPTRPPDGLAWCPHCLGRLAEHLGALDDIAARLARLDMKDPE